ncbi:MAG: dephospho-CoA kinase, partial [Planctomycetota bacterium]
MSGARQRVLRVGLTGGIACGRTTVARVLVRLGARVVDADAIAHRLLAPGGEAVSQVAAAFGRGCLDSAGGVDRRALATLVFSDRGALARLEAILHPLILAESERLLGDFARVKRSGIAVLDAALLVETGAHGRYDRLVVVACDPDLQVGRLMARNG